MEGMQYVYFEKVFGINLALNWVILWVTAKFSRAETGGWRIAAGAALGALYSFSLLMPDLSFLWTMAAKITLSLGMVAMVFAPLPWRRFGLCVGYFYLSSFTLGGAVYGLIFLAAGNRNIMELMASFGVLAEFLPLVLVVAATGQLVLAKWGSALHKKKLIQALFKVPLRVMVEGHVVAIDALIDTGNSLRDPVSQKPVIIVEAGVLEDLLPPEIQSVGADLVETGGLKGMDNLSGSNWAPRLRLIPFSALGTKGGLLLAFRPDAVEVIHGLETIRTSETVIGIFPGELSGDGSYRGLLHPDILAKIHSI
ncbi:MAG: sigma-E processing peptidase SpoIIGA [Clostridia bacterium]|nr:sigma-E processing peptidase SpoIIGA [Clostridia bacterium]